MSHDMALKLLGLSGGENKTRAGVSVVRFPNWVPGEPDLGESWFQRSVQVSRTVEDFSEQEVTKAFQGECQTLGESSITLL